MLIRTPLFKKLGKKQVFLQTQCCSWFLLHQPMLKETSCTVHASVLSENIMECNMHLSWRTTLAYLLLSLFYESTEFFQVYFYLGLLILQCKCCQWSAKNTGKIRAGWLQLLSPGWRGLVSNAAVCGGGLAAYKKWRSRQQLESHEQAGEERRAPSARGGFGHRMNRGLPVAKFLTSHLLQLFFLLLS